jgi:hypothetical protein
MDHPVKYRNMILQIILMIVTLGIYAIYWFYQTACEMKSLARDPQASPALWTIFLFIPIANLYAYYKHGELFEKISDEHLNRWILFILWLVLPPAVWFIVQIELNKRAGATPQATA